MRKLVMILFLSSVGIISKGQNLVPNDSFEEYYRLPCHLNVFYLQDLVKDWVQPLLTTSDYWSTLSDGACFLNPANINSQPRTGNAMAGVIAAELSGGNKLQYREYLEVKLSQQLNKGSFYNVEYYARNSDIAPYVDVLRSNNLGVAFAESQILSYTQIAPPDHLLLNTEIKDADIIDDNWNKIGGCFLADSNYQYLLIGNFEPIDSTSVTRLTFNNTTGVAYYLIDDVKVEKLPYDVSHLTNQMTYCHDQPFIRLNAFTEGAIGYSWDNGSDSSALVVTSRFSKDYVVNILFNECSYEHVFRVKYVPPLNLGPDTLMCNGEVLVLRPFHPGKEFEWSDNTTDSIRNISTTGTYQLSVLSGQCLVEDAIEVKFIDCPGFLPNILTMNGDELNNKLIFENIDNRIWSLEIFNRWGERVFFSEHYQNDWNGKDLSDGIYYYKLSSADLNKVVKGWVQTVR